MPITSIAKTNETKVAEKYMLRCLEIARKGLGLTWPNPCVGSVIVHNDKIIGEGYTSPFGGAHAEVNAINSVTDTSLLKDATLYVSLEPCAHYGKTPPCADLIIAHGIPEVIIGIRDPHIKVAGKGIALLKKNGCKVSVGVLEDICKIHHRRFLTFHEQKRPYIVLKWAETKDGFIAPLPHKRNAKPTPYWITNLHARQRVHQWRTEEQAILVGTRTVLADNPSLNVRDWKGKSPHRIILDRTLKIDPNHHVLDGSIKTIICTEVLDTNRYLKHIDYEEIDFTTNVIAQICAVLYKHQIMSVLVEGGSQTLQSFIAADLWDEARVFVGQNTFNDGLKAPAIDGRLVKTSQIGSDTLKYISND